MGRWAEPLRVTWFIQHAVEAEYPCRRKEPTATDALGGADPFADALYSLFLR